MERLPFFVYGTLRKMFHNHGFIINAFKDVEDAEINGILTFENGLPWVYSPDCEGLTVKGELYTMSDHIYDDVLRVLDRLEGHPTMYTRTEVETLEGNKCWCYIANGSFSRHDVIESGDFAEFMGAK